MRLYVRHPDGYGAAEEERRQIKRSMRLLRNLWLEQHRIDKISAPVVTTLIHDGHAEAAVSVARRLGWTTAHQQTRDYSAVLPKFKPDHALVWIDYSHELVSHNVSLLEQCVLRLARAGIPVSVVPI